MPKDQFGMKLYPGNRVVVDMPAGMKSGIIASIDEGKVSIADSSGARPRPGHIVVMVDVHVMFDPNSDGTIGSLVVAMGQPEENKNAAFEVPGSGIKVVRQ